LFYSIDKKELDSLLAGFQALLIEQKKTLATAESCTAGLISYLLTEQSGSSAFFLGGFVAYSNDCKSRILGVSASDIDHHGAVSEPVAVQMAQKAREQLHASYGIGITGIAGPGGATPNKPVGTVWLGFANSHTHESKLLALSGERDEIRAASAYLALESFYHLVQKGF